MSHCFTSSDKSFLFLVPSPAFSPSSLPIRLILPSAIVVTSSSIILIPACLRNASIRGSLNAFVLEAVEKPPTSVSVTSWFPNTAYEPYAALTFLIISTSLSGSSRAS